ncbi:MAG TPA: winged helix-turn-helix domain-containing protein [Micropepsaceae bacterium]|nr:winged helix-turn-helix domain-containing protein [Micropepsaceae bacterium]
MLNDSEDSADGAIELAHSPDFALGAVVVRPSNRMLENGANREVLEPRVMQVLVALVQARGAVVSRDDLVRRCWEGRAVSEDAINRCIARLRRISEADAGRHFTIDTIPRVGYRLIAAEAVAPAVSESHLAPPAAPPPPQPAIAGPAIARRPWVRFAAITAGAAGVIFALNIAAMYWLHPRQWVVDSSRAIVATPLIERHPALSPDGTMLIYSAGKDVFTRQLYLQRLAGGDPIRLTDDNYDHVAPNWSRDGSRIVYVAVKDGEPCHIFIMPVPAGLAREVARCITEERSRADWDAAGQAVYFSDSPARDAAQRIYRLDIATGQRSEVTHPPPDSSGDNEPSVSPDGRRIGFLRYRNEADTALIVRDFATGAETAVARQMAGESPSWAWAENSRDIYGSGPRNTTLRRYFADGATADVFSTALQIGRLSRGPNGLLAAEMDTFRSNVVAPPAAAGGEPVALDPANNETWGLSFAPDGTMAVSSNRSGEDAIWLTRPGKPASQLLAFSQTKIGALAFSPDGQRIAAVTERQGSVQLLILSAGGTQLAAITLGASDAREPQWLPTGDALVIPVRDNAGYRIVRVDLGQAGKITPLTGPGWVAVRLHKATLFGMRSDQPGIWAIGQPPRLITAKLPSNRSMQWQISGDDLVYFDASDRAHRRLIAQPLDGGAARVFADVPRFGDDAGSGLGGEFAINPQTGQVVYTSAVQVDSDIYLLHLTQR